MKALVAKARPASPARPTRSPAGRENAQRTERLAPPLILAREEREVLEGWARRATTPPVLAERARAILACAAGRTNTRVAREMGWTERRVGQWRSRFLAARLDGLLDEPRLGAPRKIVDAQVDRVVTLTLGSEPPDATPWNARAMGARCGLSPATVRRIWGAFGLEPPRTAAFKFSLDALLVGKLGDLAGLYLDPSRRALALCVDETLPAPAAGRAPALSPMRTGQIGRRTHDHVRRVATALFAALDARSSAVVGRCHPRRRLAFRTFLDTIDGAVPEDLDVCLVLASAGTDEIARLRRWLTRRPRYHLHVAPAGATWLRLATRWFGLLTLRQMHLRAHCSTRALETAIGEYITMANARPNPFIWTATTDELLAGVGRVQSTDLGRTEQE